MWGRATLTIVVSRTTMSWEVRITKRKTVGLVSRLRRVPGRPRVERGSRTESEDMGVRPFRWYGVG